MSDRTLLRGLQLALLGWGALALATAEARPTVAANDDGCRKGGCHPTVGAKTQKYVHGPVAVGSCRQCHQPLGGGLVGPKHDIMQVPVATAKLCLVCHAEIAAERKQKYEHRPVLKLACGFCHHAHSSNERFLLRPQKGKGKTLTKLCLGCHRNKKSFAGPHKHQPAVRGKCAKCHRAHGSSQPHLLRSSGGSFCYDCHSKAPWRKRKVLHKPVAQGRCSACHGGHSAAYDKLLKQPKDTLCRGCHPLKRIRPVHEAADAKLTKHCYGCHEVHGANKRYLLKDGR